MQARLIQTYVTFTADFVKETLCKKVWNFNYKKNLKFRVHKIHVFWGKEIPGKIFSLKKKAPMIDLTKTGSSNSTIWDVIVEFSSTETSKQMENFFYSPKQETNTQKKGELFSFFEIFTAEFSHFLVTKKTFFLSPKSD